MMKRSSPIKANIGNDYLDYLVHEVQAVCNCPEYKALIIVSYVNSLGSNPLEFIKRIPDHFETAHPDADTVIDALEDLRVSNDVKRYSVCFPAGYENRKARRKRELQRKKGK